MRAGVLVLAAFLSIVVSPSPAVSLDHAVLARHCACLRVLRLGANLGPVVPGRIEGLLHGFFSRNHGPERLRCSPDCSPDASEALLMDLYFGNVSAIERPAELRLAARTLEGLDPNADGSEAFVLASAALVPGAHEVALYADGLGAAAGPVRRVAEGRGEGVRAPGVTIGAIHGAYRALEKLGFAFLHPLGGALPPLEAPRYDDLIWGIQVSAPRWPVRGMHYHTEHPLELTDLLQGLDVPMHCSGTCRAGLETDPIRAAAPNGSACVACVETFDSMLPAARDWFEWCVAAGLNRIQWILLATPRMGDFVGSMARQERLGRICAAAHTFGLACGAVVPLADRQQHGWYMTSTYGKPEGMIAAVQHRVDWVVAAGFDFLSTESGLSEFTHPDDDTMLLLLNVFANHTADAHGMETSIKVHCSTGQVCEHHDDPRPGRSERLNFNFLPTHADRRLGVMPHTVQPFALDDAAPVYGNRDFRDMFEYTVYEMLEGERQVIWYGESAYWVSVDIDVPLFLPVYGDRRIHDLRLLAERETTDLASPPLPGWSPKADRRREYRTRGGKEFLHTPMDGQITFSSGFEWGYYLNDLVAAMASWDPRLEQPDDEAAFRAILAEKLEPVFGQIICGALSRWVAGTAREQVDLLIYTTNYTSEAMSTVWDHAPEGQSAPRGEMPADLEYHLPREEAHRLFEDLDENGDGELTYGEIKNGMAKLRRAGAIDRRLWASELLAAADADTTDSVDEEEFWFMLTMQQPASGRRTLTRAQSDVLFRQLDRGSLFFSSGRSKDGGGAKVMAGGVAAEALEHGGIRDLETVEIPADGLKSDPPMTRDLEADEGDVEANEGDVEGTGDEEVEDVGSENGVGTASLHGTASSANGVGTASLHGTASSANGSHETGTSWTLGLSGHILGEAGDGLLHYGEIRAGMKALREAGQVSPRLWASQLRDKADASKDGAIDADEFFNFLRPQPDPELLMGLGYLSGFDTWAEIPRRLGVHMTQGNKVLPTDWTDPMYIYVAPMLDTLVKRARAWVEGFQETVLEPFEAGCERFADDHDPAEGAERLEAEMEGLAELAAAKHVFSSIRARDRCAQRRIYLLELFASAYMTELRAEHVATLYEAQAPGVHEAAQGQLLEKGRGIIRRAELVVRFVETYIYRAPLERVSYWRTTCDPTAYRFGYLWAVHTLYFWWRDQGRAEGKTFQARRSPCYLNRMDPTELALGLDKMHLERLKGFLNSMPRVAGWELGDCLAPPVDGFRFPEDL